MSPAERDFIKSIDKVILTSGEEDLKPLKELDLKTQLTGISFYEICGNAGAFYRSVLQNNIKQRK